MKLLSAKNWPCCQVCTICTPGTVKIRATPALLDPPSCKMASNEDNNFLSPPRKPSGGYQRMISWELSQVQDYLTEATKPQKKNKKRTPSKSTDENELDFETINLVGGGEEGVAGYLVTNSDGEEELYYSAPQSPLTSDDDTATIVSDSTESSLNQFDSSLISSHMKHSKLVSYN